MILGLNGFKGSGKDTVAAYLIKEHGFERRAFADPLKKSIAAFFDIPYHKVDEYKNDPEILVELVSERPIAQEALASMSFREALQRYGTEAHRGVFGEDIWIDITLPRQSYPGRKIAITDLRFENEAQRVIGVGGFVVKINRPGLDNTDQHSSEAELPPELIDFTLENNGTIDDLNMKTSMMLTVLGDRYAK